MANIKSAKKRIKVSATKTLQNRRIKNSFRSTIKSFNRALAEGNLEAAKNELGLAEKKLMKAAAKGTIHKNTASRKVSRLTKAYNKALAE